MKKNTPANFRPNAIYTLAQNGTDNLAKPAVILRGKGSEVTSDNYGKRKGKKKMISQIMARKLVDIAREKGEDEKPFWNTFHCLNRVYYSKGKIYGNYCKNRFCTVCTAIRKADKINTYFPVLREWRDPHFVTLTIRACKHDRLREMMLGCIRAMKKIIDRCKKRGQRGKGKPLVGIRSLECNFNPVMRTYNPHFHIIVPDKETAETLKAEWLKLWTSRFTYKGAQKIDRVNGLERALIETIKYGSKIFTEPEMDKNAKSKNSAMIYARAFYNIIEAMNGLRIFDRFGFNLPKKDNSYNPAIVTTEYAEWLYLPEYCDWQNTENELTLTGCQYPELLTTLQNNVDSFRE